LASGKTAKPNAVIASGRVERSTYQWAQNESVSDQRHRLCRFLSRSETRGDDVIVPFQIPWDPEGLADLKHRLGATRWNDAVVSDWSYGMERGVLQ
jgi:hypothetical protein